MIFTIYRRYNPYLVAIVATAIALLLTLLLKPLLSFTLVSFFLLAVAVSTWYGGFRPGLLSTALSVVSIDYFFIPPVYQFNITNWEDLWELVIFLLVSLALDFLFDITISKQSEAGLVFSSRWLSPKNEAIEPGFLGGNDRHITAKNQAEIALRESEEKFRQLAENIKDVFWMSDFRQPKIIYVSPAYETLWGHSRDSIYQNFRDWLDAIHPEDRQQVETAFFTKATQGFYDEEYRIIRPDGSIRWIRDRAFPVKNKLEKVVRLAGIAEDISERKQVEDALRKSEQRLQFLVGSCPSIIVSVKPEENYATNYISENVFNILGYEAREFLEDPNFWADRVHPEDRERIFTNLTKVFERPIYSHEYRFRVADGNYCWLLAQLRLIKDDSGNPIEILGYAIDITDRKMAELNLRESERRWRCFLDNLQLLVVGLDCMGNVEYVNPFFLKLSGYSSTEAIGKNWFKNFLPPSTKEQVNIDFHKILAEGFPANSYQNTILTKAGEERLIAWNNTILQNAEGKIIGVMSIGEDITQRQAIERMKNEFISIVSHELRTPLTSIHGSLGLLATGIYDRNPEKSRRMLEIAVTDSERLVRLVNDILDLERLDSGKVTLVKEVCDAAELMQITVEGMQAIADRQSIAVSVMPVSAKVWASRDSIVQTLTNLLSNAIKFSPAHTTITLSANPSSDRVIFQVKDQGRGIPADKLETIFGRFQQVDASDSRQKGGTGLGLAICKSIVQQHGGKIWVESIAGKGSIFYFALPISIEE